MVDKKKGGKMFQKLHLTALVRATALMCVLGSAGALAFDYGGFRSGMTPETVKAIAARQGFEWHESGPSHNYVYLTHHTPGEAPLILQFCQGRLGWISVPLKKPDNFATLVDTLAQLTEQLGSPTVEAESKIMQQRSEDGTESRVRGRTITFYFPRHGTERQELIVNGDSDTAFSLEPLLRDTSICPGEASPGRS
jgi:hypothetical protein